MRFCPTYFLARSLVLTGVCASAVLGQTTKPATSPATAPAFEAATDAKAACDAMLALAAKGDVDGVVAAMLPRPNHPDPKADARQKAEAIVKLLKSGSTIQTFDGYRVGSVAMIPMVGQRPMRPGRVDPDPLYFVQTDGGWKALLTIPRNYALPPDQKAAAAALLAKWREIKPTFLQLAATQPAATQPAATQP